MLDVVGDADLVGGLLGEVATAWGIADTAGGAAAILGGTVFSGESSTERPRRRSACHPH